MDDTRTRDSHAGRPRPELPESLAWLYDPPAEDPAAEPGSDEPAMDDGHGLPHDPEALPTLLPVSAPAEEPAPAAYAGPVQGLRNAFARFEGARPEADTGWEVSAVRPFAPATHQVADGDPYESDEPEADADGEAWHRPQEYPVDQDVPTWHDEPDDERHEPLMPDEPDDAPRDGPAPDADATADAGPEPPFNLFEPVALAVPPEPPEPPVDEEDVPAVADVPGEEDEDDESPPGPDAVLPAENEDRAAPALPEPLAKPSPEPEPKPVPAPVSVARPRLSGLLGRPAAPEPPLETAAEQEAEVPPITEVAAAPPIIEAPPVPPVPPVPAEPEVSEPDVVEVPLARPFVAQSLETASRPDLADPALTPVWTAVRSALGGSARHTAPALDVRGLDRFGRRALAGLLGVPTVRAATRIDLAELERVVQEIAGLPLTVAAERFLPMTGRRGRAQSRTAPIRAGQDWLDAHPELGTLSWTATWLETVRRDLVGGDTGLTENEVVAALQILRALTAPGAAAGTPWRVRQEVAADVAGDEHALDEGSAVAALVLRGLAASVGALLPSDAAARRRLWARFGVLDDLVSTTCLVVGVAPADDEPGGRWRRAADEGLPVHVTARDLRSSSEMWVPVADAWPAVLVVASTRVLDALAGRLAGRVAVVCTDGAPGPLTLDLLARLRAGGADLRFLTDFDQAGLALGTQLAELFGATPWRMSAEVYRSSVRSDMPALGGRVAQVPWAAELATAMGQTGRSIPVEQLLDDVLADLGSDLEPS